MFDGRVIDGGVFGLVTSECSSVCLVNCYRQNGSQQFFLTMACISLNRVCTRVVQDKLYQLLVNKNQNTIYRQTRNFNNATGTINLTKRNHFHEIGFNSIARNLAGSLQVNIHNQSTKNSNRKITKKNQMTNEHLPKMRCRNFEKIIIIIHSPIES